MHQEKGLSSEQRARIAGWARAEGVPLVVLFGSRARGEAVQGSDVDLAVWRPAHDDVLALLRWYNQLEDFVGADVEIVTGPEFDPVLGWEIARDGQLVFESVEGTWPKERARLWHVYNDSLPFRRARRRLLADFAAEVRRGT